MLHVAVVVISLIWGMAFGRWLAGGWVVILGSVLAGAGIGGASLLLGAKLLAETGGGPDPLSAYALVALLALPGSAGGVLLGRIWAGRTEQR